MSFPKTVIVVVTCHGLITIDKSDNEPNLFKIPDNMKVIKMSAVTHGVCNFTVPEDVNKFIKMILHKKNKKDLQKGLKNPEKYTKTLANLYKEIEEDTVKDTMAASSDSNTDIRDTYIHHRDKSYEIITYNHKHPYMINKEYVRNNKTEQNSSGWDYGIFCLNVEGKPDLITTLKGRTYADKDTTVYSEEIVGFLQEKGVKEIILIDLSCSNFEYKIDENNKETSISERNTRSIRSNLIKDKLNGGGASRVHRKKGTVKNIKDTKNTKKRGLIGVRKTRRQNLNKIHKKSKLNITKKRKSWRKIIGAGKKEDMQKILELYKNEPTKKLLVFKLLRILPEETIKDITIEMDKNLNYWNERVQIDKDDESISYGKIINGHLNGKGITIYSDGDIYEGEFKDNLLNGIGKITFKNGTIFEGEFIDDNLNGKGKIKYYPGDVNEGEFKDNKLNGQGKITYKNGTVYEGEFKNNKLNGIGKIQFINGSFYEGNYVENNLNGQGKMVDGNGGVFEGEFKDDIFIRGKMIYPNGTFEGDFKGNRFINGKITLKNGDILNGPNEIIFANGDIYEGNYKTNFKEDENKELQIIYIKNGKGKMTYADGSVYEGYYKNNKRDGFGKFTDPADGTVYEGKWENGKRHGKGTQSNARGEIYEGEFERGKRHGQGTMNWDGKERVGTFYNDKYVKNDEKDISY